MNKLKRIAIAGSASAVIFGSLATGALAAPPVGSTGECVQTIKAVTVAVLDSPFDTETGKLGDAISDGFFGNEPNLTNTDTNDDLGPNEVDPGSSAGFVDSSLSPGPKLNGGGFLTLGSLKANGEVGSVTANCH